MVRVRAKQVSKPATCTDCGLWCPSRKAYSVHALRQHHCRVEAGTDQLIILSDEEYARKIAAVTASQVSGPSPRRRVIHKALHGSSHAEVPPLLPLDQRPGGKTVAPH